MRGYTAGCVRKRTRNKKAELDADLELRQDAAAGRSKSRPTRRAARAGVLSALLCGSGLGFGLGGFGCGCGGYRFVPLEGAAKAFLEIDGRAIAEKVTRGGDVGLRIADVAFAIRVVLGFHRVAGNFAE